MNKLSLSKGFTLIELLVVIAILGILAAVVLVAINPAQRIAEANDTQVKSNLSQVATASEACYTQSAAGNYLACDTVNELVTGTFLKTNVSGILPVAKVSPASGEIKWYGILTATSAQSGCSGTKYIVYDSATGATTMNTCNTIPTYP